MVDEKRTREELILALGGAPTPAAPSLVGWAKELGNTLKDALRPLYESAPYKRLRSFSGVSPVPPGEEDYEAWRDFTVPLVQEWECSDAEKRKCVLESLRGPAIDLTREVAMMKAQGHTVPSSRGESSRRGDSQREGFCYNCGRDSHYALDCQNKTDHARVSQKLQQTIGKLQGNTNRAWGRSNPRP
uniref:CCHC-type domain-containing protein n=1 Tax=Terrapene triunguis TaxID=2587831 RepID=A0A674J8U9_9SAUR